MAPTNSTAYGWLMLAGIFTSLILWTRVAKNDARLAPIYIAALAGAFLGAKLVYLAAEGWLHWNDPHRWMILATGKSVTGALLGGYAAVEIAKRLLGYRGVTGDLFAIITPLGILFGRAGCMMHGCCLGRACNASWFTIQDSTGTPRWPASQMEFCFNAVMLALILFLRWKKIAPGQLFHVYLMAYGAFRFTHEFLRDTPRVFGTLSGYHIAALAILALGFIGFLRRRKQTQTITVHFLPQTPPVAPQ